MKRAVASVDELKLSGGKAGWIRGNEWSRAYNGSEIVFV